jgi:hypothetical protein
MPPLAKASWGLFFAPRLARCRLRWSLAELVRAAPLRQVRARPTSRQFNTLAVSRAKGLIDPSSRDDYRFSLLVRFVAPEVPSQMLSESALT